MTINYIDISDLIEYENNPRNNDNAVGFVAESIRQFGFKVPVIIDRDNVIVAGHTRVKAARLLGMQEVPCIVADDLTPEQVTAFRIIDNKTAEFSAWDYEKLDGELQELQGMGVEMSCFGFDELREINIDDFFNGEEKATPKKEKTMVCIHCGEKFEV